MVHSKDDQTISSETSEAKRQEVRNLLSGRTMKAILKEDKSPDANVLSDRFLRVIKSSLDGRMKYKAPYVTESHRAKLKDLMFQTTSILQPQSGPLFLPLATSFDFKIWTADIRQAY